MYRIESERLGMRELTVNDVSALYAFMNDIRVMYAWEHGFSKAEVEKWISDNQERYRTYGYGYYALIEKFSGKIIGTLGPLPEYINGQEVIGIGYILSRDYWGRGYAVEGAKSCVEYCFNVLKASEIICDIRPENKASIRVAEKIGMKVQGKFVKVYRGKEMPHLIFKLDKSDWVKMLNYKENM